MNTVAKFAGGASQRGLTLVELMIAMTLGLMIVGSVLGVYVGASRNLSQNDRHARMQENARYALRAIAEDVVMAGFWGQVLDATDVGTALAPTAGDCGDAIAVFDASTALLANNYHESPAATQFTPCAAIDGVRQAGTDILAIKRVAGAVTASTGTDVDDVDGDGDTIEIVTTGASDLIDEEVYLRTNGTSGQLVDDASSLNPPAAGERDWRYIPRIYFVRSYYEAVGDGIPALCRFELDETSLADSTCLAEGIEDLHLQFGVDDDGDGVPNRYISTPSAAEIDTAIAARIFVLARSSEPDPHYVNTKDYNLGGTAVPAAGDGHYRQVFGTTVSLRNVANRSRMN
jgi:type IV pilus assembly protein PilW